MASDLIIIGSGIENLQGLAAIREIGGNLVIENAQYLADLRGLARLEYIGGHTSIFHNPALVNLRGLERLRSTGGHFAVYANMSQVSLKGVENLASVGGFLGVTDLPALESIDSLAALTHVGSHLLVVFNHRLQGLDGLDGVVHVGGHLRVNLNPHLYSCTSLWRLLDAIDDSDAGPGKGPVPDVGGLVEFTGNLPGCNGAQEVLSALAFSVNPGISGAWYDPSVPGQGVFVSVWPARGQIFLGWMTFDTARPAQGIGAILGDAGHRWLTALGHYSGNSAFLDFELFSGGIFDRGVPAAVSKPVGTARLEFSGCNTAALAYELPGQGLQGVIPLSRIAGIEACDD